jgi:hypothetical protein
MSRHNYSVQPRVARPTTVLVTEMGAGAFMIQGYPSGPSAYLTAEDGHALRAALDAAFGSDGWAMDVPPIIKPRI